MTKESLQNLTDLELLALTNGIATDLEITMEMIAMIMDEMARRAQ